MFPEKINYQHTSISIVTFFYSWIFPLNIIFYYFYFYPAFIVGKDIGRIYKHSQYQISTPSIKEPFFHFSFSNIILHQINNNLCLFYYLQRANWFRFVFQKYHPELFKHTNNDNIQSCETLRIYIYIIPTTSTPKHHAQRIGAMSVQYFNLHITSK